MNFWAVSYILKLWILLVWLKVSKKIFLEIITFIIIFLLSMENFLLPYFNQNAFLIIYDLC